MGYDLGTTSLQVQIPSSNFHKFMKHVQMDGTQDTFHLLETLFSRIKSD